LILFPNSLRIQPLGPRFPALILNRKLDLAQVWFLWS
jgi:hypothetical protein